MTHFHQRFHWKEVIYDDAIVEAHHQVHSIEIRVVRFLCAEEEGRWSQSDSSILPLIVEELIYREEV